MESLQNASKVLQGRVAELASQVRKLSNAIVGILIDPIRVSIGDRSVIMRRI